MVRTSIRDAIGHVHLNLALLSGKLLDDLLVGAVGCRRQGADHEDRGVCGHRHRSARIRGTAGEKDVRGPGVRLGGRREKIRDVVETEVEVEVEVEVEAEVEVEDEVGGGGEVGAEGQGRDGFGDKRRARKGLRPAAVT